MAYKNLIDTNIANFQNTMNARLEKTVDNARSESDRAYIMQTFCGIGELGILIFIMILFQKWYIKPIVRYKKLTKGSRQAENVCGTGKVYGIAAVCRRI